MASKSQQIINTRDRILQQVADYVSLARGGDDLNEEEDWSDLEEVVDRILESYTDERDK